MRILFLSSLFLRTAGAADLAPLPAAEFCVTSGRVEPLPGGRLRVDAGGMRGVAPRASGAVAELRFVYRGPSREVKPLASGEVRRQIGLKLRAQDSCNVVYVMWHAAPTAGVHVSVKRNPGAATHKECRAGGYENLGKAKPVPPLQAGAPHVLRAEIAGKTLRATADGVVVWEGELPAAAFEFDGPPGVRSDNGAFDFELLVPPGRGACPKRD